jgi:hypothetical protein
MIDGAIEEFAKIGYTEYEDGEFGDYYTNPEKGLTIEIRKYIDEYIKYDTINKNRRRGIDASEHFAIGLALKELGWQKE